MVQINKKEAEEIRKMFPQTHIVRTCKQNSKKHHYYCEENKRVLSYLKSVRSV